MLSNFVRISIGIQTVTDRINRIDWLNFGACRIAVVSGLLLFHSTLAADPERSSEGWSQDLLARLLTARVSESGANGSSTLSGDGMVLHSYQLRSLRLGDPGRATNLVSILQRMLPPESRVTEDRPGNTLHVLSTGTAHQSALELISAMDAESTTSPSSSEPAALPEEVRKALESLAVARPDSDQLMKIVAESSHRTEERLSSVVRQAQEESKENLQRMLWVGGGTILGLLSIGLAILSVAMRRAQKKDAQRNATRTAESLALLPTQSAETMMLASREQQERTKEMQKLMESFSIAYQADRQRNTMIMEAVAKKHGELASTLTEMEQLRRTMGDDAGKVFLEINREAIERIVTQASEALQTRAAEVGLIAESASRKMEETVDRLEVQNAKAFVLAEELERTQKEVDALFEKLKVSQESAQKAQAEANEQRRIAYEKTVELTKKEAALAGLSLLMQEPVGDILDTLNGSSEDLPFPPDDEPPSAPFRLVPVEESSPDIPDVEAVTKPADHPAPPLSDPSLCSTPPYTFRITPAA